MKKRNCNVKGVVAMLTNEMVFKIFADYMEEDVDLEIVQTKNGLAVMLWDKSAQDWS